VYPELLGEHFQFQGYSPVENETVSMLSKSAELMEHRVNEVINSIRAAARFMAPEVGCAIGFQDLEQLARTVLESMSMDSESESYDKLAWLRSWMFWIELRRTNGENEQLVLNCHFYALVAAVVALYPARYWNSLPRTCIAKIGTSIDEVGKEVAAKFGLAKLFEIASS
jgi:hypothetical protein